ncbi:Cytochrome c oxidase assembly protein cox18, mitochondrial [Gonapodya sp. JEL0774]|nr:Cytochrome c oxidase assembly protein cox18, mitochondrial [Gonapodya sp. JEL0774]
MHVIRVRLRVLPVAVPLPPSPFAPTPILSSLSRASRAPLSTAPSHAQPLPAPVPLSPTPPYSAPSLSPAVSPLSSVPGPVPDSSLLDPSTSLLVPDCPFSSPSPLSPLPSLSPLLAAFADSSPPSPVALVRDFFLYVHNAPFLDLFPLLLPSPPIPYYQAIVFASFALRFVFTAPIAVIQQSRLTRLENIQPIADAWKKSVLRDVRIQAGIHDWDREKVQKEADEMYRSRLRTLHTTHRCHPIPTLLLPLLHFPLFLSASLALRGMAGFVPEDAWWSAYAPEAVDGMDKGGVLWFVDLTVRDTTGWFGAAMGWVQLVNVQIGSLSRSTTPNTVVNLWPFRALALFSGYITSQVPVALALYWLTSAVYSLAQNVVVKVWRWKKRLK